VSALTSSPTTSTVPTASAVRCTCHDLGTGVVRVALSGELDPSSVPELDRLLDRLLDNATFVVVDLDELSFVDPAGAAALCAAGQRAGSRIVAVNVHPHVRPTLMTVGVHRALKVIDTTPAVLVDDHAA